MACGAEAGVASGGLVEGVDFDDGGVGDGGDDELGDSHVVGDVDWFLA